MVRPRFDPKANFTAARGFTYNGVDYAAGDPFPTDGIAPFRLNMLYGSRAVNMEAAEAVDETGGVVLTQTRPGYFEITAPWLDEPEKVRGKANAEARVTELREAGEPLDHHGVAIEGDGEGGWYEVKAEWEEEPRKVQGLDAAKAEAASLREAGPPPAHYAEVVVTEEPTTEGEEGETKFLVSAPWIETETYATREAAEERAQVVREAGPPEDFDPEEAAKIRAEQAEAAEKARIENEQREAEYQRRKAYEDGLTFATEGEGEAATYTVTPPGGDPETFDDETKARARYDELREAGPPDGWTAPADE